MMQGYCITRLLGGWKYTCSVSTSRSDWSSSRGAIVHLPKAQDETGALHIDVDYRPQLPRPFHVTNGKDMLTCVSIGHDADRVSDGDILVQSVTLTETPTILNDVAIVEVFRDHIAPRTGC